MPETKNWDLIGPTDAERLGYEGHTLHSGLQRYAFFVEIRLFWTKNINKALVEKSVEKSGESGCGVRRFVLTLWLVSRNLMSKVAIIMGSASDWDVMSPACTTLEEFGISYEKKVLSAHRNPGPLAD